MPTTHKKVIVRKLDRDSLHGYVAANFIADGKVEYTPRGRIRDSAEGFPELDAVVADLAA